MFQSTHPHGVRRGSRRGPWRGRCVSIHAPTRGATWQRRHRCRTTQVSIHAPTRGATNNDPMVYLSPRFQSTHPHGVRLLSLAAVMTFGGFQSTHPHGVRRCSRAVRVSIFMFQSTHPHGVRPCSRTHPRCP